MILISDEVKNWVDKFIFKQGKDIKIRCLHSLQVTNDAQFGFGDDTTELHVRPIRLLEKLLLVNFNLLEEDGTGTWVKKLASNKISRVSSMGQPERK
jgi:hypothetical protein